MSASETIYGRGAAFNPPNRFERGWRDISWRDTMMDADDHFLPEEDVGPKTEVLFEKAKSILSHNDSPDVGMNTSLNAYRGCEHGCIYCFARQTHEYLGLSSGLDFETKIVVKENAPEVLRRELSKKSWQPHTVMMSGVTDCYQPLERHFKLTRRCLEVFLDFRNPVTIVTKNYLVTRDIDVLSELASFNCAKVCLSLTSLDAQLARNMEPRAATPARRLKAIEKLASAGIPVGALVCPIIPGLTDHEIPNILQAAKDAGAQFAAYNIVRLPYANRELFESWIWAHYPLRAQKVLSKITQVRDGKLYDADFGTRMTGTGPIAEQIRDFFAIAKRKAGFHEQGPSLTTEYFRRAKEGQGSLF
jgi:DNA repair photolyase